MRDSVVIARPRRGRCREVPLEDIVGRNTVGDEARGQGRRYVEDGTGVLVFGFDEEVVVISVGDHKMM